MRLKRIGLVAVAGFLFAVFVAQIRATGSGAVADCDVCTKAAKCCEVVARGRMTCTFSEATCTSMDGDRRPHYVNACLTFLQVTREAWKGNPPEVCR